MINNESAFNYNNQIPLTWNRLFLSIERFSPGYRPPIGARCFALINYSAYESLVYGSEREYLSLTSLYPGLDLLPPRADVEYNWEVVVNTVYERAFELYFPIAPAEQQFEILDVAHKLRSELQTKTTADVFRRSTEYGNYVAQTVYEWSETDTWGHEGYLHNTDPSYLPPQGVSNWKPTYPDFLDALLPHWGKARTFAALETDGVPAPPNFSTSSNSVFYQDARNTMTLVNEIKSGLHPEDRWIAQFWSDDCPILTFTPAARWVSIANQAIAIENLDLMEAAACYAKVGMAISDAGVRCWAEKYKYNLLRPIDYIREYMGDEEWNTIMCPDGSGNFFTPNFPSYPSGHAAFGGAAAEVLADVFGREMEFTDRSHQGRTVFDGSPRTYSSFIEMAEENAYSRIPLGVHFSFDSDEGLELGYKVGERVNALPWQ